MTKIRNQSTHVGLNCEKLEILISGVKSEAKKQLPAEHRKYLTQLFKDSKDNEIGYFDDFQFSSAIMLNYRLKRLDKMGYDITMWKKHPRVYYDSDRDDVRMYRNDKI